MVGHGGSSAGSYLADPTFAIPSHCASIAATSTLRVNIATHTVLPQSSPQYWKPVSCMSSGRSQTPRENSPGTKIDIQRSRHDDDNKARGFDHLKTKQHNTLKHTHLHVTRLQHVCDAGYYWSFQYVFAMVFLPVKNQLSRAKCRNFGDAT